MIVSFGSATGAWMPMVESALVMSAEPMGMTMRGSIDSMISRAFFLSRLDPSPILIMRTSMLPMRSICSLLRVWPSSPRWQMVMPSTEKRKMTVRSPSLVPSSFFGFVKAEKPLMGMSFVSYSPGQSKRRAVSGMVSGGLLLRTTCVFGSTEAGSMATVADWPLIVNEVEPCQVMSMFFD